MDYAFLLLQLQLTVIMTISHRNVRVISPPPFTYLSAWLGVHLYVRVSPEGADSSTKVDFSWRVIRLSGNSTPGGQSGWSVGHFTRCWRESGARFTKDLKIYLKIILSLS